MATWARLLDYYLPLLLLVLALIVLLGAPRLYRRWMESQEADDSATGMDLLEDFEEAHAAGELDDEELRRVRDLLLKGSGGVAAREPSPLASPPPAGPPADVAPPAAALETPDAGTRSTESEPPGPLPPSP